MRKLWETNRGLVVFVVLMFMFRSTFADWNDVPSGSMRPTIVEGDRIFVNKMAYDVRVPFTLISLLHVADPQPGDIALFDSSAADKRLVKRVIGVPGDVVMMRDQRLYVNGQVLAYEIEGGRTIETIGDVRHFVEWFDEHGAYGEFATVVVPAGHYLMLGDSRDNSADSRVIGFVPREEFVGRSRHVVLSMDYDRYLLPRSDRFFKRLDI